MSNSVRTWLYATRPHTLGASIAPMMILLGALVTEKMMHWGLFLLAFLIAVSAQISSNLANDYFGYKSGEDTDKRIGFPRLLSTSEVTMKQMLFAIGISLSICAIAGITFVALTNWWLIIVGVLVGIGVIAYSAGKYSLSRIALGDFAVVLFFGLIPILTTYFAITAETPPFYLILLAMGIGIWEANILVCNNYRDYFEDRETGKRTLIVRMGKSAGPLLYLINSILTITLLTAGLVIEGSWIGAIVIFLISILLFGNGYLAIRRLKGRSLNKLLRYTNMATLVTGISVMCALLF